MLSTLLGSLLCAVMPSLDPLTVQVGSEPMDVGITITATQFRARSYSAVPHLFVFREMQTGRKHNMQTMDHSLLTLYQRGDITYDVAVSSAREPNTIRTRATGAPR